MTYVGADVSDSTTQDEIVTAPNVVVCALAPRGALETSLPQVVALAAQAQQAGVRFGVVGAAGSLFFYEGDLLFGESDHT